MSGKGVWLTFLCRKRGSIEDVKGRRALHPASVRLPAKGLNVAFEIRLGVIQIGPGLLEPRLGLKARGVAQQASYFGCGEDPCAVRFRGDGFEGAPREVSPSRFEQTSYIFRYVDSDFHPPLLLPMNV